MRKVYSFFRSKLAFSGQRKSPRGQNDCNTKWGIKHVFGVHILNRSDLSIQVCINEWIQSVALNRWLSFLMMTSVQKHLQGSSVFSVLWNVHSLCQKVSNSSHTELHKFHKLFVQFLHLKLNYHKLGVKTVILTEMLSSKIYISYMYMHFFCLSKETLLHNRHLSTLYF